MRRRALPPILLLAFVAGWILYLERTTPAEPAASAAITVDECPGPAFPWGGDGECWGRSEGAAFAVWLGEHGTSAERFDENYPELASIFAEPWPPPAGPPRPCHSSSCSRAVIRAVFPDWVESYAVRVADCETGGTFYPGALGDGGNSLGLFQINWPSWGGLAWVGSREQLLEAWHNARVALRISGGGSNWSHWTCA